MRIIRGLSRLQLNQTGCVIAIGNFDGVHCGHQYIIDRVVTQATQCNLPSVIMIFEPQPEEFFGRGRIRLTPLREKVRALQHHGVDILLVVHFDRLFSSLSAEQFLKEVLVDRFHARHIIIGDDFHFGQNHEGDVDYLTKHQSLYGFSVEEVEPVILEGRRISSTWVRDALQSGDLERVEQLLNRSYCLSGHIAHGDKRGRLIGFPTANIHLHAMQSVLSGVYAVKMHGVESQALYGMANIGSRPTVGKRDKLLEVYLFNFDREIYGKLVGVEFLARLRDEKKHASFDLLKQQLVDDEIQARIFFESYKRESE